MLFVLDESLDAIAEDKDHALHEKLIDELSALARARTHQKLMVFLESVDFCSIFTKIERLSRDVKSVFSFLNRQRAFKLNILKNLKVFVRIIASGEAIKLNQNGNLSEIVVPLNLVPFDLFSSPILLAENLSDAKAYVIFTRIALAAGVPNVPLVGLQAELRGGGGSAIAAEYAQILGQQDRFVLCVLDSDVRHPECPPNHWSQKITELNATQPSPFAASEVIDVYSIENLLPLTGLPELEIYQSDKNAAFALKAQMPILEGHAKKAYWRYIRLKEGVHCSDLRDPSALGKYWATFKHEFANYSSKSCSKALLSCSHTCTRSPIFRKETLQQFVDRYEDASAGELKSLHDGLPAYVVGHFDNIARLIASWMCLGKVVPAAAAA